MDYFPFRFYTLMSCSFFELGFRTTWLSAKAIVQCWNYVTFRHLAWENSMYNVNLNCPKTLHLTTCNLKSPIRCGIRRTFFPSQNSFLNFCLQLCVINQYLKNRVPITTQKMIKDGKQNILTDFKRNEIFKTSGRFYKSAFTCSHEAASWR